MFNTEKSEIEKTLESLEDSYAEKVNEEIEKYFNKEIIPYLKKNKMTFKAGNGAYIFIDKNNDIYYTEEHPKNKKIAKFEAVLRTGVHGTGNTIGSLCPDYAG